VSSSSAPGGHDVNRAGRVFVRAAEGRHLDALTAKVADAALAAALLDR
jgi:hypothetical protein